MINRVGLDGMELARAQLLITEYANRIGQPYEDVKDVVEQIRLTTFYDVAGAIGWLRELADLGIIASESGTSLKDAMERMFKK